MIRIGMLISDRYEILEKIGTGGMSDVYKAKDHKLNRFVAVKVLKQEFSENANFVSKFRVEAQAAAGLMHPNIVNVYDVGQEDGVHFIVMELVEGITLKKYIEKKARLSVKEAISIAIQVSMGIEAAHNNHIIHRDIKPQNIIISKDGKVKVTDFGIAKAATSNTITSNVMGSVHYTSPEQARGGYSDEKSDIYSLGITFFEMLTGRVPFNGETTVAIAIKHIQEDMPSPREFVSEIPYSVEQIVLKCTQKSPDRRYQSMSELIKDLKYALMNPDDDFVHIDDPDEAGATKTVDDADVSRIKRQSQRRESLEDSVSLRTEREVLREVARKENAARQGQGQRRQKNPRQNRYYENYDDGYDDQYAEDSDSDPKMEKITTILAVVAAVLIGLIVIFLIAKTLGVFDPSDDNDTKTEETTKGFVTMIDVVGRSADDVKKELIDLGLTPEIEYEESSEYAEGTVMRSSVESGSSVEEGSNVVLTVSAGETGVEVPDTVGMTEAEAVSTLVNKGFTISKTEGYDQYIAAGSIYKQSPEGGAKAPAGTSISLYISKGPETSKVSVPNLLSQDEETAMALLAENGLELGSVMEVNYEDPAYEGLVCSQSYAPGTYLDAGSKVDISISIGPIQSTYKFTDTIMAPTASEDPNFKLGTMVTITMTADDGTVLLSTQTSSFPIAEQNITGIKSESGTILFQYINQGESSVVTNEDGTTTTVEGESESKEIKRSVTFVAE
ncbi:MAG: Stk1 family PASTA domain-containing Ser/Thr kinase [Lachnospiraceae bacterium]|nr:Stk1 family PASTA domain-containing Ser/Thr kinase [Lachnospiraceae bacterium]